jgi:hypothetical protein
MTFNEFMATYSGDVMEVVALKTVFKPRKGPVTEKSLTLEYGRDGAVAYGQFTTQKEHA